MRLMQAEQNIFHSRRSCIFGLRSLLLVVRCSACINLWPLAATQTDVYRQLQTDNKMEYTEFDHLKDKEQIVTDIYEKLITELHKFGQIKVEPKKTSIHLGNRFGFAGVYTRKDYINLEVHLNYKLTSDRVSKIEQGSTNRFHHTIKLTKTKDIDKELLTWLREAYELKK
jgi:hypothetical protein